MSATIRRGTAKPDYLVIDLVTGLLGCSGAVTLFGKPEGATVFSEGYDPTDLGAPVCGVDFSIDGKGALTAEEVGFCSYYRGASCGFDGSLRGVNDLVRNSFCERERNAHASRWGGATEIFTKTLIECQCAAGVTARGRYPMRSNSLSVSSDRSSSAAARFSRRCSTDEVPGIRRMLGAR